MFLIISCIEPIPIDKWSYKEIDSSRTKWGDYDEPEWWRYFGLDAADINDDGYKDIVSGKYLYINPGKSLEDEWNRIEFEINLDAMLFVNIDDDEYPDIIAEALPDVYWIEADNRELTKWNYKVICQIPRTGHVNGQGYMTADIFKGGKEEIILATQEGPYAIEIPEDTDQEVWETTNLFFSHSDEGFDIIDIDKDGDIDLVGADRINPESAIDQLFIYVNPGDKTTPWKSFKIAEGKKDHDLDRISAGDFNGDGLTDIAASEERYPGLEPDANLFIFISPTDPLKDQWDKKILITQYSMNNLDIGDIDKDGDIDLVTNEHKGDEYKLQIFENDGEANFNEIKIDAGKECHLGTRLFDMDNDGDLDIIGHAWDNYKYLHLWRNDGISN
jgi:hypothetical protein